MQPSQHKNKDNKPDTLITLNTDVLYYNNEIVRSLKHGDKLKFNCTLH